MGGSGLRYWKPIAEKYGLDLTIRNAAVDYTFSFMTVDHDGKVLGNTDRKPRPAGLNFHSAIQREMLCFIKTLLV